MFCSSKVDKNGGFNVSEVECFKFFRQIQGRIVSFTTEAYDSSLLGGKKQHDSLVENYKQHLKNKNNNNKQTKIIRL